MSVKTTIQALNQVFFQAMERDPDVLVMGEDVGVDGGVFRITDGLVAKFPDRVFDTPLAEAGIIGTAIGLSVYGFKPICEIQFSGFIYPAFQEIVSHLARLRNRSRGRFTSHLVIRAPHFGGVRALEHHSEGTEAYYVHTPGLKVVIPSNPYDAKGLMASAIEDPDPVIFLEPLKLYRLKGEVPDDYYTVPLGKANVVAEGNDATVVTYGTMVKLCQNVAEGFKEKGTTLEVIDLRSLNPLDWKTIEASVRKTGRLVIVHEAPRSCGLGAEISALAAERLLTELKAPIVRVTGYDTIMPFYKMENWFIPDEKRIRDGVEKVLSF